MVVLNPELVRYEAEADGEDLRRLLTVKEHLVAVFGERVGLPLLNPLISFDLGQPYHNFQHAFTVAINSMRIADTLDLPGHDRAVLLVAALYHDFMHSAGECTDDENIRRAVTGLREQLTPALGDKFVDEVAALVPITEYPFVREPTTVTEMVLRDADLLQHFEPDGERFTKGLAAELGIDISKSQIRDFMSAQSLYTEAGRRVMYLGLQKLVPLH